MLILRSVQKCSRRLLLPLIESIEMIRVIIAAFLSLNLLAGCASSVSLATVATDAHTITAGLQGALTSPAVVSFIPPGSQPAINQALADLATISSTLSSASSAAAAEPSVAQIEADVNAIINAVAGLNLPAPVPMVLSAAAVLLPVIEAAVGLPAPASASAGGLTPDEARLVLTAAAR